MVKAYYLFLITESIGMALGFGVLVAIFGAVFATVFATVFAAVFSVLGDQVAGFAPRIDPVGVLVTIFDPVDGFFIELVAFFAAAVGAAVAVLMGALRIIIAMDTGRAVTSVVAESNAVGAISIFSITGSILVAYNIGSAVGAISIFSITGSILVVYIIGSAVISPVSSALVGDQVAGFAPMMGEDSMAMVAPESAY